MKRIIVFVFVSVLICNLFAQDDSLMVAPSENKLFTEDVKSLPEPIFTMDIDFKTAFTSGEFKDFYPKKGMAGLGFNVLMPLGKKNPLDVGAGFGYYFMSQSQETYSYYTPEAGSYDVNSRVSGGMISFHLISRVYPLRSIKFPIQPYIEGLAGARLFSANQRLETYIYDSDSYLPVEKDYNFNGSWSYGFGGGVKIKLTRAELLFLNLKATKIYGTPTKNMDPSSVQIFDDGSYSYDEFKSRTDIVRFTFGIHVMIE